MLKPTGVTTTITTLIAAYYCLYMNTFCAKLATALHPGTAGKYGQSVKENEWLEKLLNYLLPSHQDTITEATESAVPAKHVSRRQKNALQTGGSARCLKADKLLSHSPRRNTFCCGGRRDASFDSWLVLPLSIYCADELPHRQHVTLAFGYSARP